MRISPRRITLLIASLCALLIIAAVYEAWPDIRWWQERTMLRLFPSAQRAFDYGDEDFNSVNTREYNIDRAAYFFGRAADLDPDTPYLFHQLARVAFIRDQLPAALADINVQIARFGESEPNSYYVRGLIEGYMGDYTSAATDYAHFLQFDPNNWAGVNDYAWVLLKGQRFDEARLVTSKALQNFPDNPWLLNSYATALYETGELQAALSVAKRAETAARTVTQEQWLLSYPGNNPDVAGDGVATLQKATADNVHMIELKLASSTVQSK